MRLICCLIALFVSACGPQASAPDPAPTPEVLKSGFEFLTPETQALQNDSFENPAMLWVDRGEALFTEGQNGPSCESCHSGNSLQIAALNYPQIDESSGELINLEGRINLCRIRHQDKPALDYESDDLLGLTSFVASQSKGLARNLTLTPKLQQAYDRGLDYYFTRRGQMNLSCAQCHDAHWGQKLRGDTISQGHPNGFPAYRFEWEAAGSLHRRLSDCDIGVRAKPHELGSSQYLDLEVYLAVRAGGLAMEAPAVRR